MARTKLTLDQVSYPWDRINATTNKAKYDDHDSSLDALEALGNGLVTERVPVRCATTAAITLASVGLAVTDGVTIIDGDRVIVWKQATASENGIYIAHAGAWTRATDYNTNAKVVSGTSATITEGTLYAGCWFQLITANPINLGVTNLTFSIQKGISPAGVKGSDLSVGAPSAGGATGVIGIVNQDIIVTVPDAATGNVDVTVDATYGKFTVTSVKVLKNASAGGVSDTIQVANGTVSTPITEAISNNVAANVVTAAATILSANAVITSAAVLRVIRTKASAANDGCTVIVSGYRTT
jgi:hypothetical protein